MIDDGLPFVKETPEVDKSYVHYIYGAITNEAILSAICDKVNPANKVSSAAFSISVVSHNIPTTYTDNKDVSIIKEIPNSKGTGNIPLRASRGESGLMAYLVSALGFQLNNLYGDAEGKPDETLIKQMIEHPTEWMEIDRSTSRTAQDNHALYRSKKKAAILSAKIVNALFNKYNTTIVNSGGLKYHLLRSTDNFEVYLVEGTTIDPITIDETPFPQTPGKRTDFAMIRPFVSYGFTKLFVNADGIIYSESKSRGKPYGRWDVSGSSFVHITEPVKTEDKVSFDT
jgi:hypothetical protein